MLNKINIFFILLGLPVVLYILLEPDLSKSVDVYITVLWLSYFAPLFFTYKRWLSATGFFLYFGGLVATSSGSVLLGSESNIHYLLLIVSGLPFVFFGRSWSNKRLWLAFLSLPVWAGLEYWGMHNEPIVALDPDSVKVVGVIYSLGILMFSIFIAYNFTKSAEKFGSKIKKQRDTLEEKNARLEQFSYLATHDLKTPLSNIEGFVTLLELDVDTEDEDIKDSLDGIKMSVEQSRSTISELIGMASQKASEQEMVEVSLEAILKEVRFILQNMIEETGAKINFNFEKAEKVNFSIPGVKSLMQNLMSNSLKYRHPERKPIIEIVSKLANSGVLLTVSDNGLGIDMKKDGDKLFQKFKRIHTNAEGSGLGLSLIKSMVEERCGTIKVESELGKGTSFQIFFPLLK